MKHPVDKHLFRRVPRPANALAIYPVLLAPVFAHAEPPGPCNSILASSRQELLRHRLHARIEFLRGGKVRLKCSFERVDELNDWMVYPESHGHGRWYVEDRMLMWERRVGLHHRWKFTPSLLVELAYAAEPRGRIHLLDNGKGRGVIETDFKAIYRPQDNVITKLARQRTRTHPGACSVAFNLDETRASFTIDGSLYKRVGVNGLCSGFVGLVAWNEKIKITELTMEGDVDLDWARR